MIVFRDGHEVVDGPSAIERLRLELSAAGGEEPRALFAAAEIECAFADLDHPHADPGADVAPLEQMLRVNAAEAFGVELPASVHLEVARPIEPDARLAPHEWVIGAEAKLLKTDSADHASDHLMPGPADVAWDLAGVIVEWVLDRAGRRWFLQQYRTRSGDDAEARLPAYLAAYAAFRLGFAQMARDASPRAERARWLSRERVYRRCLRRALSELDVDVRTR